MDTSDGLTTAGLGERLRTTFGPLVAGLAGGLLTGLLALSVLESLCRNMAATYSYYPNVGRSWVAMDLALPQWVYTFLGPIGLAGAVAVGAVTVWLVRPRDRWADLSAGLTAALAATLGGFVSCLGWLVALAFVVVPSISDLTFVCQSASPPAATAEAGPVQPSEPLVERYPDLKDVEPARRGGMFMAKIVADQAAGCALAVWAGMLLSLFTLGTLALVGTLAAGHLRRRGDGVLTATLPYLEMTLPATFSIALGVEVLLSPVWSVLLGSSPFGFAGLPVVGLMGVSILMITGAIRCWPWLLRVCLGLAWLMLLVQTSPATVNWSVLVSAAIIALGMVVLHWLRRSPRVAVGVVVGEPAA